jgi:hypothetical protein
MVSHKVEAWSVVMVASITGMSGAMRVFPLKMGQRLMVVTASKARA